MTQKRKHIFTDASIQRVGAILKQVQNNGELLPVAYFSKKLRSVQMKKKATYLECFAIQEALRYWQYWLLGIQFTVISDHKPLENLKLKSRTDKEISDMVYYISQYSFTLRYSSGKTNEEADALSRNPVLEHFENSDEVLQLVNLVTLEEIKENQEEITKKKNTYEKEGIRYQRKKGQESNNGIR